MCAIWTYQLVYNGWAYFGYVSVPLHMAATSEVETECGLHSWE